MKLEKVAIPASAWVSALLPDRAVFAEIDLTEVDTTIPRTQQDNSGLYILIVVIATAVFLGVPALVSNAGQKAAEISALKAEDEYEAPSGRRRDVLD
eukprot:CAMPEP_0172661078 /NCGR_PEP_ID=MMETSP1074-20121228/4462_1 /TAXON_ID=2916 /ORGANISM="Ceratium fusus, Strain PA161109" /LENGTH=96 /DNA_ID=CAMNT_0013476795 /DNA_START=168 /DNA_END=458 /DNA_ORIENTATION=+